MMKSIWPFIILFLVGLVTLIAARFLIVRFMEKPKEEEEQERSETKRED